MSLWSAIWEWSMTMADDYGQCFTVANAWQWYMTMVNAWLWAMLDYGQHLTMAATWLASTWLWPASEYVCQNMWLLDCGQWLWPMTMAKRWPLVERQKRGDRYIARERRRRMHRQAEASRGRDYRAAHAGYIMIVKRRIAEAIRRAWVCTPFCLRFSGLKKLFRIEIKQNDEIATNHFVAPTSLVHHWQFSISSDLSEHSRSRSAQLKIWRSKNQTKNQSSEDYRLITFVPSVK